MRTIQFKHERNFNSKGEYIAKGGKTVALEVPSLEEFNALEIYDEKVKFIPPSLSLKIGIAECSKKENYNKALGRQISSGRMKSVVFYARKINESEVHLVASHEKLGITLILRKKPNSGRIYFEELV